MNVIALHETHSTAKGEDEWRREGGGAMVVFRKP